MGPQSPLIHSDGRTVGSRSVAKTPPFISALRAKANGHPPRKRLPFLRHSLSLPSPIKQQEEPQVSHSPTSPNCHETLTPPRIERILFATGNENSNASVTPEKRPRLRVESEKREKTSGRFESLSDAIKNRSFENITCRSFDSNTSYSSIFLGDESSSTVAESQDVETDSPLEYEDPLSEMEEVAPSHLSNVSFKGPVVGGDCEMSSGYESRPTEDLSYVEELLRTPDCKKSQPGDMPSPSEFLNTPFRRSRKRLTPSRADRDQLHHPAGVCAKDQELPTTPIGRNAADSQCTLIAQLPVVSSTPKSTQRRLLGCPELTNQPSIFPIDVPNRTEKSLLDQSLNPSDDSSILATICFEELKAEDLVRSHEQHPVPLSEIHPSITSLDDSLAKELLISPLKPEHEPSQHCRPRLLSSLVSPASACWRTEAAEESRQPESDKDDLDRRIRSITASLTPIAPAPPSCSSPILDQENLTCSRSRSRTSHCRRKLDSELRKTIPKRVQSQPSSIEYEDILYGRTPLQRLITNDAKLFVSHLERARRKTSATLASQHKLVPF